MPYQFTCPVCEKTGSRDKPRKYCSPACRDLGARRPPAEISFSEDGLTARIPLYARDGSLKTYTLVDADRAAWINEHRWHQSVHGYVMRTHWKGGRRAVFLHRELLGLTAGDGMEADHINRDRLDNRRANLRVVTHAQNTQNVTPTRSTSSRYRGVCWFARTNKWIAYAHANGKTHHLGYFLTEEEAAEAARCARARLLPFSQE